MAEHPKDPEILPALTAEEWRNGYESRELSIRLKTPGLDGSKRLAVIVRGHPLGGSMGDARDLHALVALALYGTPEGFTQEDVARLRILAQECTDQMESESLPPDPHSRRRWWRDMGDYLDNLAARIAALLPPPETL